MACEELRIAEGISKKQSWKSQWLISESRKDSKSWNILETINSDQQEGTVRWKPIARLRQYYYGHEEYNYIEFKLSSYDTEAERQSGN